VRTNLPADESVPLPLASVSELFRVWREPMARLAYVLTGNSEVSDEIVQDAFLNVHRRWAQLTNPVGYLRTAVINGCNSYHRHAAVERRAPVLPQPAMTSAGDEISDALAKLSYSHRAVLVMRFFCDLPDGEIADALNIRPATVRTRIHRGLTELRKELDR
jgi:RNA polymerase sigma factor (sigma-70 family)